MSLKPFGSGDTSRTVFCAHIPPSSLRFFHRHIRSALAFVSGVSHHTPQHLQQSRRRPVPIPSIAILEVGSFSARFCFFRKGSPTSLHRLKSFVQIDMVTDFFGLFRVRTAEAVRVGFRLEVLERYLHRLRQKMRGGKDVDMSDFEFSASASASGSGGTAAVGLARSWEDDEISGNQTEPMLDYFSESDDELLEDEDLYDSESDEEVEAAAAAAAAGSSLRRNGSDASPDGIIELRVEPNDYNDGFSVWIDEVCLTDDETESERVKRDEESPALGTEGEIIGTVQIHASSRKMGTVLASLYEKVDESDEVPSLSAAVLGVKASRLMGGAQFELDGYPNASMMVLDGSEGISVECGGDSNKIRACFPSNAVRRVLCEAAFAGRDTTDQKFDNCALSRRVALRIDSVDEATPIDVTGGSTMEIEYSRGRLRSTYLIRSVSRDWVDSPIPLVSEPPPSPELDDEDEIPTFFDSWISVTTVVSFLMFCVLVAYGIAYWQAQ